MPGGRLPGLRWVPVPLAVLAAVIGALVVGSLQGQVSAANVNRPPSYRVGGLALGVDTMLWMSNDMSGDGTGRAPKGYSMPSSEMPGMQLAGDDRLRVEVNVSNVSSGVQLYSMTDFSLVSASGKIWQVDGQGNSNTPASADLKPGFGTTMDMYFDLPAKDARHLTLKWSQGGTTVSIPVKTGGGVPAGMQM